jgi:hypothetical protein
MNAQTKKTIFTATWWAILFGVVLVVVLYFVLPKTNAEAPQPKPEKSMVEIMASIQKYIQQIRDNTDRLKSRICTMQGIDYENKKPVVMAVDPLGRLIVRPVVIQSAEKVK